MKHLPRKADLLGESRVLQAYRLHSFWVFGVALIAGQHQSSALMTLPFTLVLAGLFIVIERQISSRPMQTILMSLAVFLWSFAQSASGTIDLTLWLTGLAGIPLWALLSSGTLADRSVAQTSDAQVETRTTPTTASLPRWMSEFVDTYGMPTHLRTSRNYIEICNESHSSYVRLSLTSAAQQIPKELGLRIHKEYYVFRGAVKRNIRDNGRHLLDIGNEIHLPVGRSFLASVKAEGLIN